MTINTRVIALQSQKKQKRQKIGNFVLSLIRPILHLRWIQRYVSVAKNSLEGSLYVWTNFFFEKNDLQRPKMLKKWFLVIFKAHSPLRQKNGIFKRDQTQNHACLTQTNDFIPYTNIYNQIIIWGPYLAISGHCDPEDDRGEYFPAK